MKDTYRSVRVLNPRIYYRHNHPLPQHPLPVQPLHASILMDRVIPRRRIITEARRLYDGVELESLHGPGVGNPLEPLERFDGVGGGGDGDAGEDVGREGAQDSDVGGGGGEGGEGRGGEALEGHR